MDRLSQIDYAISYWLEKMVTSFGYYPNKDLYLPNDQSGFDAELASIVSLKGFYIAVKSNANYDVRGEANSADLVVTRKAIKASGFNQFNSNISFEPDGNDFTRQELPDTSFDLEYEIRLLASSVKQERICSLVLSSAFGMGKYINLIDVDNLGNRVVLDEQIYISSGQGGVDLSGDGYIEKLWIIMIHSAKINETKGTGTVPAINDASISLEAKKLDGTDLTEL